MNKTAFRLLGFTLGCAIAHEEQKLKKRRRRKVKDPDRIIIEIKMK